MSDLTNATVSGKLSSYLSHSCRGERRNHPRIAWNDSASAYCPVCGGTGEEIDWQVLLDWIDAEHQAWDRRIWESAINLVSRIEARPKLVSPLPRQRKPKSAKRKNEARS